MRKPLHLGILSYLEVQTGLDLLSEDVRNGFIEAADDLHGELRLDAPFLDHVIQRIDERQADAVRWGVILATRKPISKSRRIYLHWR